MVFQIKQGLFKLDIIDYHAILGVPVDANANEIRQRYLKVVTKLHPDTCKANNPKVKEQANNILARLVNPAYETLSKDKLRIEHLILLSQKATRIAQEGTRLTLTSARSQSLAKAGAKLETIYHKLITALAIDEYRDLDKLQEKIAQISEINLVYLVFKATQKTEKRKQQNTIDQPNIKEQPSPNQVEISKETYSKTTGGSKISPLDASLKRAQEYREYQKYKEAILELRDGLEIDPNNANCHALLGLVYLEQNSLSLAKVHIGKAWQTAPEEPIVIEAKKALDEKTKSHKTSTKNANPKPGMFSNLFGKKK